MFDRIRRRNERPRPVGRGWLMRACVVVAAAVVVFVVAAPASASEADLAIPDLHAGTFNLFGTTVTAWNLLLYGALVICGTLGISLYLRRQIRLLPAHRSMLAWRTSSTRRARRT